MAHVDGIKVLMIPVHPSRVSQDTMIRKTKAFKNTNHLTEVGKDGVKILSAL